MIKKEAYIGLLYFLSLGLFCQNQKAGDPKKIYLKVLAGPSIGFFSGNTNHTTNTRPGPSFFAGLMEEAHLVDNIYASAGLEYQYYNLSFNSYYMAPGYQFLYNQKYDFNYNLTFHETRLNLLMRLTSNTELTKPYTFYGEAGYVLRCIVANELKVVSDLSGKTLFNGPTHTDFQGETLKNHFASGIKINVGIQHNFLRSHKAWFVQLSYMKGLAPVLIHDSFTPTFLNLSSSFAQLGLGFKF